MSQLDPSGATRRVRAFLDAYGIPALEITSASIRDGEGRSTGTSVRLFAGDIDTILSIAETLGDLNDLPTDQSVE